MLLMKGLYMNEILTFAELGPQTHTLEDIYRVGETDTQPGVIPQLARLFDYELAETPNAENLGGLIGATGKFKELQENLPQLRKVFGADQNANEAARDLAIRAGALTPVERYYGNAQAEIDPDNVIKIAVMTGGIRNYMGLSRPMMAAYLAGKYDIESFLLIGGNRAMKTTEGKDVVEGMTEADYLDEVTKHQLYGVGIDAEVLPVNEGFGDTIMAVGAKHIAKTIDLDDPASVIALVSNPGSWVQNGGQMRRGLQSASTNKVFDASFRNFMVVSGRIKLGETATEPTLTHQNPFTTQAQTVRNAQEYVKHVLAA
jgi:hypothetical protein